MNVERIIELANHIEALDHAPKLCWVESSEKFDMSKWNYECGSPACMAGHALWLLDKHLKNRNHRTVEAAAAELLELDEDDAEALFTPVERYMGIWQLSEIEPKTAAAVLRNFAKTGNVEWNTELDKQLDW